jgi:S-adenosylhomocysteine hydrolase
MRTYKTWEVVKILMENPRLRFEAKINKKKSNMWIDTDGDLVMDVVKTAPDYPSTDNEWLNAEWHLVETPVTWQEALQAWAEEKTVICKFNDINEEYSEICFSNDYDTHLTRYQILYGQWFIVPEVVEE